MLQGQTHEETGELIAAIYDIIPYTQRISLTSQRDGMGVGYTFCSACGREEGVKHKEDCRVSKAMKLAQRVSQIPKSNEYKVSSQDNQK